MASAEESHSGPIRTTETDSIDPNIPVSQPQKKPSPPAVTTVASANEDRVSQRRALGQKAKEILVKYAEELPSKFNDMDTLTRFKLKLTEKKIIEDSTVDLKTPGVSAFCKASGLYDAVMSSLESNPDKFPDLISVLELFTTLNSITGEIKQTGRDAGLLGGPT